MCLLNLTNSSLFNHLIFPTLKRRKYHHPEAKTDMTDAPPTDCRNDQFFDRLNLDEVQLSEAQVCGGEGLIRFARLCHEGQSSGSCRLIGLAEIPPGSSLGRHRHEADEEEFCLVLNRHDVTGANEAEPPCTASP